MSADTVVARTELPGNVQTVNLASALGVEPADVASKLTSPIGSDVVAKGEVIAATQALFGLFKSEVKSPVAGTIESVSDVTGQLILREPPIPVEVDAYLDGTVVEVIAGGGRRRRVARRVHPGDLRRRRRDARHRSWSWRRARTTSSRSTGSTPALEGQIVVGGSLREPRRAQGGDPPRASGASSSADSTTATCATCSATTWAWPSPGRRRSASPSSLTEGFGAHPDGRAHVRPAQVARGQPGRR